MTQIVIPTGIEWELVIVDNNSSDDTPHVLHEFMTRLPIRSFVEARPGVSHARNTALANTRGEYILCTDDDVLVDRYWLKAYVDAFRCHTRAVVFGGPVLPWFEAEPPNWLLSVFGKVDVAFAVREFDGDDLPLSDSLMAFGANMAFRSDVIKMHQFDPALGRVEGGLLGGEETTMIRTILLAGHSGRWVPGARVQHYIPRARQNVNYLREWYAGYGRTMVRLDWKSSGEVSSRRPLWIWRELVVSELLFRFRRIWSPPSIWIDDLKRASTARGQFDEFGARGRDAGDALRRDRGSRASWRTLS